MQPEKKGPQLEWCNCLHLYKWMKHAKCGWNLNYSSKRVYIHLWKNNIVLRICSKSMISSPRNGGMYCLIITQKNCMNLERKLLKKILWSLMKNFVLLLWFNLGFHSLRHMCKQKVANVMNGFLRIYRSKECAYSSKNLIIFWLTTRMIPTLMIGIILPRWIQWANLEGLVGRGT